MCHTYTHTHTQSMRCARFGFTLWAIKYRLIKRLSKSYFELHCHLIRLEWEQRSKMHYRLAHESFNYVETCICSPACLPASLSLSEIWCLNYDLWMCMKWNKPQRSEEKTNQKYWIKVNSAPNGRNGSLVITERICISPLSVRSSWLSVYFCNWNHCMTCTMYTYFHIHIFYLYLYFHFVIAKLRYY